MVNVSENILKIYTVIVIATLTALLGGYFFSHGSIFLGTLVLLVFLVFFGLQVILLGAADHYLTTAVLLNSLGWAVLFYQAISLYFLLAFAFLFSFLFLAARKGKEELANSLKISVGRVVRAVVGLSLTAVIIFIFVAMILGGVLTLTQDSIRNLTNTVISPIASRYVKDFSPDMETGEFFKRIAERNIAIASNKALVNQAVAELKKKAEGYAGTQIDLRRSVEENLYQALQFKLSGLTPEAKVYWLLIILGIIFLAVKSIEFLIALPLILVSFIIYQLLLIFNFASLDFKDRSQEVVILSK